MKQVFYASVHDMSPAALKELETIFGQVEIIRSPDKFLSGRNIIEASKEIETIAIQLPLNLVAETLQLAPKFGKEVIQYQTAPIIANPNYSEEIETLKEQVKLLHEGWFRLLKVSITKIKLNHGTISNRP